MVNAQQDQAGNDTQNSISLTVLENVLVLAIAQAGVRSESATLVPNLSAWISMLANVTTSSTLVRRARLRSASSRLAPARISRLVSCNFSAIGRLLRRISSATRVMAASTPSPASTVFSDDLRHKRQMRAEERAARIPTKLLFPLVLFIFPSIIMVVLGPAIIQMMRTLIPMISGRSWRPGRRTTGLRPAKPDLLQCRRPCSSAPSCST